MASDSINITVIIFRIGSIYYCFNGYAIAALFFGQEKAGLESRLPFMHMFNPIGASNDRGGSPDPPPPGGIAHSISKSRQMIYILVVSVSAFSLGISFDTAWVTSALNPVLVTTEANFAGSASAGSYFTTAVPFL